MMNYIWAAMICLGIGFACFNGTLGSFTDGLMESCTQAVEFVIGLIGIMAVWSGLMNIAEKSGLIEKIAKRVNPFMHFLFPCEKDDHRCHADELCRKYLWRREQCYSVFFKSDGAS